MARTTAVAAKEPIRVLQQMPFVGPEEYAAFRANPYFIESSDQLGRIGGEPARVGRFVRACTWAVFTPDTIVRRNGGKLLEILAGHGLHPVACQRLYYNRNIPREFWRRRAYVLILPARMLVDLYLTRMPSLGVLLRADGLADGETAAARLHRSKGPALSVGREPHHIRSAVGTRFPIINGIHAPDSALDFIADLGVFLAEDVRGRLLASALDLADAGDAVQAGLQALHGEQPAQTLDVEASRRRLREALDAARDHMPSSDYEQACVWIERIRAGEPEPWMQLLRLVETRAVAHQIWDMVLLGASSLEGMRLEQYE